MHRVPLNSTDGDAVGEPTTIIHRNMSHLIAAFDVSMNGNFIIWTDGNSLYKSDMDGEKMEVAFNYGNTFWHLFVLSFLQIYFLVAIF